MFEEEDHNDYNVTNNQKEDGNDVDTVLIKDNKNVQHSETTVDSKNEKTSPEESELQYIFQE